MINMLKTLMAKLDNMQEHMGNVRKEIEIIEKNQKETLEIKNTNRNEKCLCRISKLDTAGKESLSLRICQ